MVEPRSVRLNSLRLSIIWKNFFLGLGGLALISSSVLALIQTERVIELDHRSDRQRRATECRFDINAETDAINGDIDVTVAEIVVAAISDDEVKVQHLGELLAGQVNDLQDANDRRLHAVEECNAAQRKGS